MILRFCGRKVLYKLSQTDDEEIKPDVRMMKVAPQFDTVSLTIFGCSGVEPGCTRSADAT